MKNVTILALTTLLLVSCSFAQDLDLALLSLSGKVKPVSSVGLEVDQKLLVKQGSVMEFNATRTNEKGKTQSETFLFNLSDLDKEKIEQEVSNNLMTIKLRTKEGLKYITEIRDGKSNLYTDDFKIIVSDIDEARELMAAFQKAISLAEEAEIEKYNFSSTEDIYGHLFRAIQQEPNDKITNQKLVSDNERKEKLQYSLNSNGKVEMYEFYLKDVDFSLMSLDFGFFSNTLSIKIKIKNEQKMVKVYEDGKPNTYTYYFDIYPSDIENAKRLLRLLKMAGGVNPMEVGQTGEMSSSETASHKDMDVTNGSKAISSSAPLDKNRVPEPDFPTRPYGLDGNYNLIDLDRTDASIDVKVKGLGYGGGEMYYTAFSPAATVRFEIGNLPRFIVQVGDNVDPSSIISMGKAEVKGNQKRRFLQSSMAFGGKARDVSDAVISLDFKKIKDGLYEIIIEQRLEAGEYAFMPISSGGAFGGGGSSKITCFGVE